MSDNELGGCPAPCSSRCPVRLGHLHLRRREDEYVKVEDLGPSVFCVIRDSLGLDPRYKPHRNVDAVRLAKLMSKLIKMKLCKRALSSDGKLCWRFLDDVAYDIALETLKSEQGANNECMFLRQ